MGLTPGSGIPLEEEITTLYRFCSEIHEKRSLAAMAYKVTKESNMTELTHHKQPEKFSW